MTTARLLTLATATLALGAFSAGCGGSPAPPSPTPPATGAEAAATNEASWAARATSRRIDPRRNGLEVVMGEWAVTPEARVIRPGPVMVVISNRGR